jgi:hypothetical protein
MVTTFTKTLKIVTEIGKVLNKHETRLEKQSKFGAKRTKILFLSSSEICSDQSLQPYENKKLFSCKNYS